MAVQRGDSMNVPVFTGLQTLEFTVAETGEGVTEWRAGDRVAIKPIPECGECPYCR